LIGGSIGTAKGDYVGMTLDKSEDCLDPSGAGNCIVVNEGSVIPFGFLPAKIASLGESCDSIDRDQLNILANLRVERVAEFLVEIGAIIGGDND